MGTPIYIMTTQMMINKAKIEEAAKMGAACDICQDPETERCFATTVELEGFTLSVLDRPNTVRGMEVEKSPLVFVHGFLDSWRSFSQVLDQEATTNRRAVSITLRGWGDSAKTGAYTIDSYAADIIAVLDKLQLERVTLVGHSMGTLVATAVAARHPDRVAGLVLCGAGAKVDPDYVVDPSDGTTFGAIGDMMAEWKVTPDMEFLEAFQLDDLAPYIEKGKVTKQFAEQVMGETLKADMRAYYEAWKGMCDEDHTAELTKVTAPAILVWGTGDGVFPRAEQDRLMRMMDNTTTSLHEVEGAPHGVNWTHPEEVAIAIAKMP